MIYISNLIGEHTINGMVFAYELKASYCVLACYVFSRSALIESANL